MKKARPAVATSVADYLAAVPEPASTTLKKVRALIRSAAPAEATEGISWGMPMFKYKGMLLGLAAFSNHCSIFPGPAVIAALKSELKGFHTSKGTIQFPLDKPLSAALVRKVVKARIAQNERTKK
jgi:uncharacterized protein YdhG (YjbR/CyaY superfamily)